MDIFNLNLPPEENEKYPKLDSWFDFMNGQMEKLEEVRDKGKLNSLLFDSDIEMID